MKLDLFSRRTGFLLLALSCAGAMGFALYAQYVLGLEPCPMCIMQRIAVIATGIFALLAALLPLWQARVAGGLAFLSSLSGGAVAARQVWLQQLPWDQVPACGPGLDYMLETMPLWSVFSKVLKGSGECAVVDWTLFGLSMPMWSGLFFAGALGFTLLLLWRSRS